MKMKNVTKGWAVREKHRNEGEKAKINVGIFHMHLDDSFLSAEILPPIFLTQGYMPSLFYRVASLSSLEGSQYSNHFMQ